MPTCWAGLVERAGRRQAITAAGARVAGAEVVRAEASRRDVGSAPSPGGQHQPCRSHLHFDLHELKAGSVRLECEHP